MNSKTSVFLRADGNSQIGLGHVHRLLTLAEILRHHFECTFVIRSALPGIRQLILENCHALIDLDTFPEKDELKAIKKIYNGKEIVVLDGYSFDTTYQKMIKSGGSGLVCIDDIHQYHFVSDVVINPSGGVRAEAYSKESYTKIFTGPEYALIKKSFRQTSKKTAIDAGNNSLLICLGGADPANYTLSALKYCLDFDFDSIQVIIGEAYRFRQVLEEFVKRKSDNGINILSNLEPSALAEVMKRCAVAVCPASGISYEYLTIGGELYVIQTADNQLNLYTYLINSGLAFPFENFRVSTERVSASVAQQHKFFDGQSDKRILKLFSQLDFKLHGSIRKAAMSDVMVLFRWANDPELRKQSYNPAFITLEDHTAWFTRKMADPSSLIYIFEYKNVPVALLRFDIGTEAMISYSIDKEFRGKGWGEIVVKEGIDKFNEEYRLPIKIIGYVKHLNESSNRIFKALGFKRSHTNDFPDSYKYEYIEP